MGASIVDISLPGEDSFLAGREEAKKLLFLGMAGGQVRLSLCEEAPAPPFFLKKAVPALGWVQKCLRLPVKVGKLIPGPLGLAGVRPIVIFIVSAVGQQLSPGATANLQWGRSRARQFVALFA